MLAVQFLFGMTVNLWGALPSEMNSETPPAFAQMAFAAHGLLALGILISSSVIIYSAWNVKKEIIKKFTIIGFASIIVAFIAGVSTFFLSDNSAEVASFVMALAFLAALFSYGRLYLTLK